MTGVEQNLEVNASQQLALKEINARIQDSQRINMNDSEFEAREKEKTIYKKIQGRESYEG